MLATQSDFLPVVDKTQHESKKPKAKRRAVEQTLSQLRVLHEQLNAELYRHPGERPVVNCPADAAQILTGFLGALDHEELWVVDLDVRNRIMSLVRLYVGSVSSSQIRVGEVFREAVRENASSILLCHNHPSGDPTPSPEDVAVTRAIVEAGRLLDVEVLDHLVVCLERFVSLKERGLGFG